MTKILTKADILACRDARIEPLDVPEWGGTVYIRMLTVSEAESIAEKGGTLRNVDLLAMAVCDEKGAALFSEGDIEELNRKNGKVVADIAKAIVKHNSMDAQAVEVSKGN